MPQRDTIVLLGVNHKTTPVEVREKLALSEGYEEPLAELGTLSAIGEFYLLSTCNRLEVLFCCTDLETACDQVLDRLFRGSVSHEELERCVYRYQDEQAVEHLFMVASSLDSMIVGEAQILGQMKEAFRYASEGHTSGLVLNKLLHKSFSVAKRVRTETRIGANAVSISYAAVELARKIFGSLEEKKVMLLGAGEMAELAAEHFVGNGVEEVVVVNRTLERGIELARRFNGRAASWNELVAQLVNVDIIVSSTGASDIILERGDVQPMMRERRNRPLFFIDIAVPRDLDPELNDLDNVYLYDIDDLSSVVEMNKSERENEARKAERIVAEETIKFGHWLDSMEVTPTIIALRRLAEEISRDEVERTLGRLGELDTTKQKAVEKMAAAIVAKLLHHPLQYLKKEHHCVHREKRINTVRELFALDGEAGDEQ
jgi:glutamyl-tRNA reductase